MVFNLGVSVPNPWGCNEGGSPIPSCIHSPQACGWVPWGGFVEVTSQQSKMSQGHQDHVPSH